MATSVRLIRRYVWLVNQLMTNVNMTFEKINQRWLEDRSLRLEGEGEIPERTFHRHREGIADLFGIDIAYRRSDNVYYIENPEMLENRSFTTWVFYGMAIDNLLIGNEEIKDLILFEESNGGMELMPLIVEALAEKNKLRVYYDSLSRGYTEVILHPYFVKERLRRWYVIGKVEETGEIRVFALDRIDMMDMLNDHYEYPADFNPKTYFDEVVGVLLDEEYDCERVVLRLYNNQARYVDLLPLHKSQREIGRGKGYVDFEYHLRPEWEFIHEVLRLGREAEILEPQWLRDELRWQAAEIANRYRTDDDTLFVDQ